ncbi:SWIM zinc finger family protein, partial [Singulisphaera rosea]
PIRVDRGAARRCFELRKADGTFYHVAVLDYGAECTCPDFVFNRDGLDPLGCKHIRSLVALGIIDTRATHVRRVPPSAFDEESETLEPLRRPGQQADLQA